MHELLDDVRLALRVARKRPALTLTTILSLGLGIGANTAILSIANTLFFRPLPFEDPERVVRLRDLLIKADGSSQRVNMSERNFLTLREQAKSFAAIGGHTFRSFDLVGPDEPERVSGLAVTANTFPLLGVRPVVGRTFSAEEDRPGAPANVVVIGHGLWSRQYSASADAVGKTLLLSETPYTIIGVAPPRFDYPYTAEVWVPLGLSETPSGDEHHLHVVARYAPGIDREKAQSELDTVAKRLQQTYPETNEGWQLTIVPIRDDVTSGIKPQVVYMLLAASFFLLVIGCANAANVLLAHSLERSADVTLRSALGARRGQLVRQQLVLGVVLALLSAVFGIALAHLSLGPIVALSPISDLNLLANAVRLDLRVLAVTLLAAVAIGLGFSLVPALRAATPNLQEILKEEGRATLSRTSRRLLQGFVVAEVALAVILLTGAVTMLRTLQQLQRVDPGFDTERQITMQLSLPGTRYASDAERLVYLERLGQHLRSVPGVESAQTVSTYPLSDSTWGVAFVVEGRVPATSDEFLVANLRTVNAGFFTDMKIPLLGGRGIGTEDTATSQGVVVVSKGLADKYWPGQDPVGRQLKRGRQDSTNPWLTVVGMVDEVDDYGDFEGALYFPQSQQEFPNDFTTLVIRTATKPRAMLETIRREIWSVSPTQAIFSVYTADEMLAELHGEQSFSTFIFLIFAGLGLTLAAIGIYGILFYSVMQRRHEIGMRMALGARATDVLKQIVGEGLTLAGIGLVVGVVGAFVLSGVLRSQIENLSSIDATAVVTIMAIALLIAAAASYLPARRATAIDPVKALRHE